MKSYKWILFAFMLYIICNVIVPNKSRNGILKNPFQRVEQCDNICALVISRHMKYIMHKIKDMTLQPLICDICEEYSHHTLTGQPLSCNYGNVAAPKCVKLVDISLSRSFCVTVFSLTRSCTYAFPMHIAIKRRPVSTVVDLNIIFDIQI